VGTTYRVGEFAAMSGISVRTLHHYDQLGLLRPSGRTESGYRLYTEWDMLYLQQILTLRYLGFSLEQVGQLLRRPEFDLVASLRAQREVLRERIAELQEMGSALDRLLAQHEGAGQWDWALVARASAAASQALAQKGTRMDNEQMMKRFEELGKQLRPGEREEMEQEWTVLMEEVKANLHLDPTSPKAVELAGRWNAMTEKTYASYRDRGFDDLWQAVGEKHKQNAFADHPHAPSGEMFAFIARVNQARK
jgi:MerR family transcriptional regulator, thiopeptide resistance regulator